MPTSRARQLIDEAFDLEAEDLAADFIETQVGRFYFNTSWKEKRNVYLIRLNTWLEKLGKLDKLLPVTNLIDELADGDYTWNDRYADDYGGMSKPRSSKARPKKRSTPNAIPDGTGRQAPA